MPSKHHVNIVGSGFWLRGQQVCLEHGNIVCKLARDRYNLVEAYEHAPHLRFLGCKTDQQLSSFVQRWGPLYLTQPEVDCGISKVPIERYRVFRGWLEAVVRLMDAYRNSDDDNGSECRNWLAKFFLAELALRRQEQRGKSRLTQTELEFTMRGICGIKEEDDTSNWIRFADLQMIRLGVEYLLRNTPLVLGVYLEGRRQNRKLEVEARWSVLTLEHALPWMVWYDEFNQHSLRFCRECLRPFRAGSAHRRKYDTQECAHRVAARNWRRRDLEKKRKLRQRGRNKSTAEPRIPTLRIF